MEAKVEAISRSKSSTKSGKRLYNKENQLKIITKYNNKIKP